MDPYFNFERLYKVGQLLYKPRGKNTVTSLLVWRGIQCGRHTGHYVIAPGSSSRLIHLHKLDTVSWSFTGSK